MTRDLAVAAALAGPPAQAACRLLGWLLTSGPVTVRITEVEAYAGPDDPASHAWRGRTPRTAVMFGPAGHAYVYLSYGMHHCLNVVTGPDGTAAAALVRAGEVVQGAPDARLRRPAAASDADLARGPGRLAAALGLDRSFSGLDLLDPDSPLRLVAANQSAVALRGPRVGVARGADTAWRFWLPDEPTVSAYRRSPRAGPAGSPGAADSEPRGRP